MSGLKVNINKSYKNKGIYDYSQAQVFTNLEFHCVSNLALLGVSLSINTEDIVEIHFENKFQMYKNC
jgi:hypothetical protein